MYSQTLLLLRGLAVLSGFGLTFFVRNNDRDLETFRFWSPLAGLAILLGTSLNWLGAADLLGDVFAICSVAIARPALLLMHGVANFLVNSFAVILGDSVANLLRNIQTLLLCFDLNCGLAYLLLFVLTLHLLDRSTDLLRHSLAGWQVHRGAALFAGHITGCLCDRVPGLGAVHLCCFKADLPQPRVTRCHRAGQTHLGLVLVTLLLCHIHTNL